MPERLELWQLAFCSGSGFKMGVLKRHGNVRGVKNTDAAGKILPWVRRLQFHGRHHRSRATEIVRFCVRRRSWARFDALDRGQSASRTREKLPWIVRRPGLPVATLRSSASCPFARCLPTRQSSGRPEGVVGWTNAGAVKRLPRQSIFLGSALTFSRNPCARNQFSRAST